MGGARSAARQAVQQPPVPLVLPAIMLAERVADGLATDQERADGATAVLEQEPQWEQVREEQVRAAYLLLADAAFFAHLPTVFEPCQPSEMLPTEPRQSNRFRDIFGNPFRPVAFDPPWLTSTVLALANGIYSDKAFDCMPILADALQDAGCDNEEVLQHCRGENVYVRGCWVVDLLLRMQ